MIRKARLGLVAIGTVAALLVGATAAGAAYAQPVLLRQAGVIRLKDVANAGRSVAVGWQEGSRPGALWVRTSTDGGATFRQRFAVAGLGPSGLSLAICNQQVWAVSAARYPGDADGDADLLLSRRSLQGGGAGQWFLTSPGVDHAVKRPDVACVGDSLLAMAWIDRTASGPRASLLVRDQGSLLPTATNRFFDLGPAIVDGGIALTAAPDAIHVAWTRGSGSELATKRFAVGSGRDPAITPARTVVRAPGGASLPVLAARGTKVVLAYTDDGQLKMRRSEDGGKTYSAPLMVVQAGRPTTPARATSIDVRSQRVVIEVQRRKASTSAIGPAAAGDDVPYRYQSTDGGDTWSKQVLGNRGIRIGVLRAISGGASLLLEAWHDDGQDFDTLRFQREVS